MDINYSPEFGYIEPRPRPRITEGITVCTNVGCGNLYVTINSDSEGLCEIFATLGKSGGCPTAMLESTMRLASILLRCYVDPQALIKQFKNIRCPNPSWDEGVMMLSCADAVAKILQEHVYGIKPEPEGKNTQHHPKY